MLSLFPALLLVSDQVVKLTDTILLALPAIIISIGTLIATIRNGKKTDKVKDMVNGRMDELLSHARQLAHQEGKKAAVQEMVQTGQVGVLVSTIQPDEKTRNESMGFHK